MIKFDLRVLLKLELYALEHIAGRSEASRSCPAWRTPSPSQRPMDPPRSERREDRWKGRKDVVVTFIWFEKVMSNCELL